MRKPENSDHEYGFGTFLVVFPHPTNVVFPLTNTYNEDNHEYRFKAESVRLPITNPNEGTVNTADL